MRSRPRRTVLWVLAFACFYCALAFGQSAPLTVTPGASLVLVHGGNRFGEIFPCSCNKQNQGGIDREAWQIEQLRKSASQTILVESGGLMAPYSQRPIERLKLRYLYQMLTLMGYDAINVGHAEARIGVEYLKKWEESYRAPLVSANIFGLDGKPLFKTYRILERKDSAGKLYRIGITGATAMMHIQRPVQAGLVTTASITREAAAARVSNPSTLTLISRDPVPSSGNKSLEGLPVIPARIGNYRDDLAKALQEMKSQCDLTVVLFDGGPYEAEALALILQPDFLVTNDFQYPLVPPAKIGKTLFNFCGQRGQMLGRMDLACTKGEPVRLIQAYAWMVQKTQPQTKAITDLTNAFTKESTDLPPIITTNSVRPPARINYTGYEQCQKCHTQEHEQWAQTAHAHAFDQFKAQGGDLTNLAKLRRLTTGYGDLGGFTSLTETAHLTNVQCEVCHGPGYPHQVQQRLMDFAKRFPDRGIVTNKTPLRVLFDARFCMSCHDAASSPSFNYDEAIKKVRHLTPDQKEAKKNAAAAAAPTPAPAPMSATGAAPQPGFGPGPRPAFGPGPQPGFGTAPQPRPVFAPAAPAQSSVAPGAAPIRTPPPIAARIYPSAGRTDPNTTETKSLPPPPAPAPK
ncbi:MAG: multiheme c-type cytochrome [Candidatus Sumerlaeota bacterium]|nr:multiheme c-type cytochrome [Candidatus Sumerlaeota bacterium]